MDILPVVREENRGQEVKGFPVEYKVSELICIRCKNRWIAVRPESTSLKDIECPKCHKQGFSIETGQIICEGGKE